MDAPAADALLRPIGVQHERLRARLTAGMPRAGWKVCVNDPRMQRKLGLEGSFAGFLDGDRALASGASWEVGNGAVLGVEPEIALHFAATPVAATRDAMARAIDGVAAAIEVVDWRAARFDLESLATSSSFHAGFVTGALQPLSSAPAIGEGCPRFRRGEDILGVPDPALMPEDAVGIAVQVARFLARFGEGFRAGDWLLCGACTPPARVEAGDEIEADFGTAGAVRVQFNR